MDLSSNSGNSQKSVDSLKRTNYFPFTKGKGLEKTLEIMGYKYEWIIDYKKLRIISIDKFVVCKAIEDVKKVIYIRPDNIRKKIKSSFHKNIIKIINNKIKKAYSDKNIKKNFFNNLPQSFIRNINRSENQIKMDKTFEQLLVNWDDKKNKKIIKFLDENNEISEKSNWNLIKNMTYKDLLKAFFESEEFEKSIIALKTKAEKSKKKEKNVSPQYIENYINIALKYIDFFSSPNTIEDLEIPIESDSFSFEGAFDNEYIKLLGEPKNNSEAFITPENNNPPLYFKKPSIEFSCKALEDEAITIKKFVEDEECHSKKDMSSFDDSLDENGIKKDCFEKDIQKVMTEHDKIHS
jgi:hypothetical protein